MNETDASGARLLVVDDVQDNITLLNRMLSLGGYKVWSVSDGQEALELAQAGQPDLILLDIVMPGLSGYDICERLKADERTRHIPVIFISALSEMGDKVKGFSVGGVDYVTKPFQLEEVLARVETHLTLHRLQKSLQERNAQLEREAAERARIQEELRQSEKRYRLLAESASDVIWTLDLQGRFTYVSPSVERLRGYTPDDVMRQPLEAGFTPESTQVVKAGLRRVYEALLRDVPYNRKDRYELEQPCKDGTSVWTEVTTSVIYDEQGHFGGVLGVTRDITERRRAEEALRKSEAALREHAAALEAQNAELDAFAHTVAHDLKNFLGGISGHAGLLASYYDAMSREQLQRSVQNILQGVDKMGEIIESLLLLAGVRKQAVQFNPLDMAAIVAEAWQRLERMAQERQAEIVWPAGPAWPVALGYAPWVEEVWVNYLSNALKYGGQPPRIELGAELCPAPVRPGGGPEARFWVRDNGLGLTPQQQARLFTPFTRLHTEHAEGHGLGLSIVQRIVEKLGGRVGVESEPGQGSTFWFTLPTGS